MYLHADLRLDEEGIGIARGQDPAVDVIDALSGNVVIDHIRVPVHAVNCLSVSDRIA
jgi:hypothetical protein